uniref:Uncharacterized protein n=1 Tax=Sphaerodactylus townsendi TaxID=933632 RepID=A0ACB8FNK9_9SAUR
MNELKIAVLGSEGTGKSEYNVVYMSTRHSGLDLKFENADNWKKRKVLGARCLTPQKAKCTSHNLKPLIEVMFLILDLEPATALTVRFLTKRFIGEYSSDSEKANDIHISRELVQRLSDSIMPRQGKLSLTDELHWADGFVLVYDISDRTSFAFAKALLYRIRECHAMSSKRTSESTVVLVGNKQDLCHIREVSWDEGQKLALDCKCQFCELSAAEHSQEVVATFTKLLKNIISNSKGKERRRPSGSKSMAKLINTMFGKRRKSV